MKNYVYVARDGLVKGLKRKGGFGFFPRNRPLSKEHKFLLGLNLKDKVIYDIGGFEGLLTLFFARKTGKTGKVITFEPNPENYNRLIDNVKLNNFENVEVKKIGLGSKKSQVTLIVPKTFPARGSVEEVFSNKIVDRRKMKKFEIEIDSLDNQIASYNLPKPDFIKIDVEGFEMEVLLGMAETIKRYKPKIHIELHNKIRPNISERVIDFLLQNSYSVYFIEGEENITEFNKQMVKGGHIYCT